MNEFKMLRQSVVNAGKMEILITSTETKEGEKKAEINWGEDQFDSKD